MSTADTTAGNSNPLTQLGSFDEFADIPGTVLAEGIDWSWESFPQYLDALAGRRYAMDIGAQLPHAALRM